MATSDDRVEEGFIDRHGEHTIARVLVPRVGAVLQVAGRGAHRLANIARTARSAWVGRVIENVSFEEPPWATSCALEYTPGVSLLSLLAQSQASARPLPVQAAAHVVHDAALALEAVLHARAACEPDSRVEAISPLSVRVGFNGAVLLLPTLLQDPALADIIGVYRLGLGQQNSRGIELGPAFSPEGMGGVPVDASEPVFFLGALLAITLGNTTDLTDGAVVSRLHRLLNPATPRLPDYVSAPLRDLISRSMCVPSARLPRVAEFTSALRAMFDLADARVALAAHVSSLFPAERAAQQEFVRGALQDAPTQPSIELRAPVGRVPTLRLNADVRLVTHAEFDQFLKQTLTEPPTHYIATPEVGALPIVLVSHEAAAEFCRWRGGRLPTNLEWTLLSRERWCRDLGRVWEWTAERGPQGGWLVRGGPWRNQAGPGLPDHQSWETEPAPDVGFRCVYDLPPEP